MVGLKTTISISICSNPRIPSPTSDLSSGPSGLVRLGLSGDLRHRQCHLHKEKDFNQEETEQAATGASGDEVISVFKHIDFVF